MIQKVTIQNSYLIYSDRIFKFGFSFSFSATTLILYCCTIFSIEMRGQSSAHSNLDVTVGSMLR
jgi:hypothetical protein